MGFNILYCLSNSPYIFPIILKIAKKKNIPIIHNQNGYFYDAWYKNNWKKKNLEISQQHYISDYVFYQSKYCKINSSKFLQKKTGPNEILYNAVDLKQFKPRKKRKKNKSLKILMSGIYNDHLGYAVEFAVKALYLINKKIDADLVLAGFYSKFVSEKILKIAKKLKIEGKISFIGKYSQSQAPRIYQDHDIYFYFVQNASCSNAVIEAIACGLPVVYSKSGGTSEIVDKKSGIGIKCKKSFKNISGLDIFKISEAVFKIKKNYHQYSTMARKKALKDHDIRNWILRHKIIFSKFLKLSKNIN